MKEKLAPFLIHLHRGEQPSSEPWEGVELAKTGRPELLDVLEGHEQAGVAR